MVQVRLGPALSSAAIGQNVGGHMTRSFSFLLSLITLISNQYMLLTWRLPLESLCFIVCRSRISAAATSDIVMMGHDRGGGWSWTMITTRLLDIQYAYSHILPLLAINFHFNCHCCSHHPSEMFLCTNIININTLSIMLQTGSSHQWCKYGTTRCIYCTSVRPGRGIPHMWLSLRFLPSFLVVFFTLFLGLKTEEVSPC